MDLAERNALVAQFVPLAHSIAIKLWRQIPGVRLLGSKDDVASVGMFALIRAAELYDPEHWSRAKFITYASRSIRNRVIQAAKSGGMIRLPWYIVDEINDPGNDTPKHRQARAAYGCRVTTEVPEDPAGPDGEDLDPEILDRVLSRLDARDRELVMDYWGLAGRQQRNTRALAQVYGISYQQVCNRLKAIRKRLRRDVEFELDLQAMPR